MRAIGGGPDAEWVIAAQRGDRAALDALLAEYLPLIYNIVGRAMNGHADVDDVVQETMLRAVRSLADLRDPAAFRSWLVAVAVRQVRDYVAGRQLRLVRDPAFEVADPGADFEDLTILQLGLSGQRRETAEASRWLDPDDREVLALWWQEAAGTLDRGAVASGLGLPVAHAAVRISRMKERLTTSRLIVRALQARPGCTGLAEVTSGWDHAPSPLWRKRLGRHARDCPRCNSHLSGLVPAERLLNGIPLVAPPLLALRALTAHAAHAAHAAPAAAQHGWLLPKLVAALQPKAVVAAVAAAGCVAGAAVVITHRHPSPPPAVRHHAPPPALAASTPSPPPALPRPHRPPPARVTATLKGVGAWPFTGATQALAQSGSAWYYTWSAAPQGIVSPPGVQFVPMIWGAKDVNPAELGLARSASRYLLGFNEPDLASQAHMSVAEALRLWPRLEATGMTLGSPAVATGAATPGGWLDRFMRGARARGDRVDFITVHWYGADFTTGAAVSQLRSYLGAIHARYHLPIWMTELGLVSYGGQPQYPTDQQQAAFVTAAAAVLGRLGYVQRYAWFALPVSAGDGNLGLFASGPAVTAVGRAFEAARG